jgi:hypothetical protein
MQLALVVGFAESLAVSCTERLGGAGFVVTRAAHGPAACERAKHLRPHLIVVSRSLWSGEKRALVETAHSLAARVVEAASLADIDGALAS